MDADLKAAGERHVANADGECSVCIIQISPGLRFKRVDWPCDAARFRDALAAAEARLSAEASANMNDQAAAAVYWRELESTKARLTAAEADADALRLTIGDLSEAAAAGARQARADLRNRAEGLAMPGRPIDRETRQMLDRLLAEPEGA